MQDESEAAGLLMGSAEDHGIHSVWFSKVAEAFLCSDQGFLWFGLFSLTFTPTCVHFDFKCEQLRTFRVFPSKAPTLAKRVIRRDRGVQAV